MSQHIGKHPLGYKESGTQEDGLLGDSWETVDADKATGSNLIINLNPNRVRVKWVKNTGSVAIVPASAVQVDIANDMAHSVKSVVNAGEPACGICDPFLTSNVAAGEKFLIITDGITDIKCGEAIAVGAPIGVGALGVAIKAANAFGRLIEAATVAAQIRKAVVSFSSGDYSKSQVIVGAASAGVTNTILPSSTLVHVNGVTVDANDFIVLPPLASVPIGHRITVVGGAGANFEVRTPAASNEEINSEDCDGTKEYLFTNTQIHYFTKIDNTIGWMGNGYTAIGAVATAVVPD